MRVRHFWGVSRPALARLSRGVAWSEGDRVPGPSAERRRAMFRPRNAHFSAICVFGNLPHYRLGRTKIRPERHCELVA